MKENAVSLRLSVSNSSCLPSWLILPREAQPDGALPLQRPRVRERERNATSELANDLLHEMATMRVRRRLQARKAERCRLGGASLAAGHGQTFNTVNCFRTPAAASLESDHQTSVTTVLPLIVGLGRHAAPQRAFFCLRPRLQAVTSCLGWAWSSCTNHTSSGSQSVFQVDSRRGSLRVCTYEQV